MIINAFHGNQLKSKNKIVFTMQITFNQPPVTGQAGRMQRWYHFSGHPSKIQIRLDAA